MFRADTKHFAFYYFFFLLLASGLLINRKNGCERHIHIKSLFPNKETFIFAKTFNK